MEKGQKHLIILHLNLIREKKLGAKMGRERKNINKNKEEEKTEHVTIYVYGRRN